jgi:ribosome-binding ATPase YchF (GTP1/OBG family)
VDPIRDAETVETELMLADLDSLEKRVPNLRRRRAATTRNPRAQLALMEDCWRLAGRQARAHRRAEGRGERASRSSAS